MATASGPAVGLATHPDLRAACPGKQREGCAGGGAMQGSHWRSEFGAGMAADAGVAEAGTVSRTRLSGHCAAWGPRAGQICTS